MNRNSFAGTVRLTGFALSAEAVIAMLNGSTIPPTPIGILFIVLPDPEGISIGTPVVIPPAGEITKPPSNLISHTTFSASNEPIFLIDALNPNRTVKWQINSDKKGSVVSSPAIGSDGTVYVGGGVVTAYGDVSESKESNSNPDSKSPGFEIIILITTVFLIIYIKKKKG